MKKPKKVTVKFFLNTHLKSMPVDPMKEHEDWGFPLYTQVTYDRKNTQIKCNYGGFYKNIVTVHREHADLLRFEESIFRRCVLFELEKRNEDFQLRGLGEIYDNYSKSIPHLFNNYLKMRLKNILPKARPTHLLEALHFTKQKLRFYVLYEASLKLFDNVESLITEEFKEEMTLFTAYLEKYDKTQTGELYGFPVVIDWLDNSHIKQIREDFPEESEKLIILLDKIIQSSLELT